MNENSLAFPSIKGYKFRASGRVKRSHFMPKVVSHRIGLADALNPRFRSFLSVFIPKLTPTHRFPRVFLHVSNGASSCLIRCKDPHELADSLDDLVQTLRSDRWGDAWFRLEELSQDLNENNRLILDEELVDLDEFNKALQDVVQVNSVQVEG